jgi:hypothetical protein
MDWEDPPNQRWYSLRVGTRLQATSDDLITWSEPQIIDVKSHMPVRFYFKGIWQVVWAYLPQIGGMRLRGMHALVMQTCNSAEK